MEVHLCRSFPSASSDHFGQPATANGLCEPSVQPQPPRAPQLLQPHPNSLGPHQDAVRLGQGNATDGSAGDTPKEPVGEQGQGRDLGSTRGAVAAGGRGLDAPGRPLDARARRLGAQGTVLAEARGGPLEPGRRYLQEGRPEWAVAQATLSLPSAGRRLWRSESDLIQSETPAADGHPQPGLSDASPPGLSRSSSDADSERNGAAHQPWRSESHLSVGSGTTLSQRHRSQPCLLSSRPDYSGVSSRVAAYIECRRQQDREHRARRRASRSGEPSVPHQEPTPRGDALDYRTLAATLDQERAERKERERQLEQLQTNYDLLVTKYAEAETYIDKMRFHSAADLTAPNLVGTSQLSLYPGEFGPDEGHAVQSGRSSASPGRRDPLPSHSAPFLRLNVVRGSLLRRHSGEGSSIGRSIQAKTSSFRKENDGPNLKNIAYKDEEANSNSWEMEEHQLCSKISEREEPSECVDTTYASSLPSPETAEVGPQAAANQLPAVWTRQASSRASPVSSVASMCSEPAPSPSEQTLGAQPEPAPEAALETDSVHSGSATSIGTAAGSDANDRTSSASVEAAGPAEGVADRLEATREPAIASDVGLTPPNPLISVTGFQSKCSAVETPIPPFSHAPCDSQSQYLIITGQRLLASNRSGASAPSESGDTAQKKGTLTCASHGSAHNSDETLAKSRVGRQRRPKREETRSCSVDCSNAIGMEGCTESEQELAVEPDPEGTAEVFTDPGRVRGSASASKEKLHSVLSILASQVELIQAMVSRRRSETTDASPSSRSGDDCAVSCHRSRSLSRMISSSHNRVSDVSASRSAQIVNAHAPHKSSNRKSSSSQRTQANLDAASDVSSFYGGPTQEDFFSHSRSSCRTASEKESVDIRDSSRCRENIGMVKESTALHHRQRKLKKGKPREVGPDSDLHTGAESEFARHGGASRNRVSDGCGSGAGSVPGSPGQASATPLQTPAGRRSVWRRRTRSCSPAVCDTGAPGGDQLNHVPRLPLAGLLTSQHECEPSELGTSISSLVSHRTVSPTQKVELWRARLLDSDASEASLPASEPARACSEPVGAAAPDLRGLAGAVRGLQRQMSGFCRLIDQQLRASPASSLTGSRPRRRYLRERRGLQLPLLPDKPAPLAGPSPAAGPRARRWDIARPRPARTASCERAVQTETAQQPPVPARSESALDRNTANQCSPSSQWRAGDVGARWDRANQLARQVNLRSRCILEGVMRNTAC